MLCVASEIGCRPRMLNFLNETLRLRFCLRKWLFHRCRCGIGSKSWRWWRCSCWSAETGRGGSQKRREWSSGIDAEIAATSIPEETVTEPTTSWWRVHNQMNTAWYGPIMIRALHQSVGIDSTWWRSSLHFSVDCLPISPLHNRHFNVCLIRFLFWSSK